MLTAQFVCSRLGKALSSWGAVGDLVGSAGVRVPPGLQAVAAGGGPDSVGHHIPVHHGWRLSG